jgi:uncharacterized protein YjbI with pentapeptide repeats
MSEVKIFEGNGYTVKILDPSHVTVAECLEIAKCGATAWNSWQELKPNKIIIPESTKIPEQINFSRFQFSSQIEFHNVTFETTNNCCFENTTFKQLVQFHDCTFKEAVNFKNAVIQVPIRFRNLTFEKAFDASNSTGGSYLEFNDSTFKGSANFSELKTRGIEHTNSRFIGRVNFSGSRFSGGGYESYFRKCTFYDSAHFTNVVFEYPAIFQESIFKSDAIFSSAEFIDVYFSETNFIGNANFQQTKFIGNARFSNAKFNGKANFTYAQFGKFVNFKKSEFLELADFRSAQFIAVDPLPYEDNTTTINFSNAYFAGKALFDAGQWSHLKLIYKYDYDDRKKWADQTGVSADQFASIDFSGAIFKGKTSFQGRKFIGSTNFGPYTEKNVEFATEFSHAPNFHECEFHQNTTFYKAKFLEATGSDEAARAYRTLKLVFQKKYDLRQEQQFYRLEIQQEAKLEESKVKKITFWMYQFFSGYGFSIIRPLIWLIFITHIIATSFYAYSANLEFCNPSDESCKLFSTLFQFSLSGIPGFERIGSEPKELLFPDGLSAWVLLILALHKLAIVTGLFLIGLALRNLFKMK